MNSLGFDKSEGETRVIVAMSGGVDSSTTAAWLHDQGYDVVGVTLQLYDQGAVVAASKTCCAGQDIYDARRVADQMGFPHYVLDYESAFRQSVIDDFADSYLKGETPIPCVRCNQSVKFRDLLDVARDLGGDCLVTGHYIRRIEGATGPELHRAVDDGKDQSYFLFATTPEQLDFLRFPLGDLTKAETRALAGRFALPIADKPDSQDICFVPTGDYAGLVARLRPGSAEPGEITHLDGRVLGHHDGTIHYTIGQRKGLGIGGRQGDTEPLYVVRIEPASRRVVVGPKAALARDSVYLKEINWLGLAIPESGLPVMVKLRSAMPAAPATFYPINPDGTGTLHLASPHHGIAPGQAGVIYAATGSRVLGGGWITAAELTINPQEDAA